MNYVYFGGIALIIAVLSFIAFANADRGCEILGDIMTCTGNIEVVQEGLDQEDIDTLWEIWKSKIHLT